MGLCIFIKRNKAVVAHVRAQRKPTYLDLSHELLQISSDQLDTQDALFADIVQYVKTIDEVFYFFVAKKFRIGYNRSARIIDTLEAQGLLCQVKMVF